MLVTEKCVCVRQNEKFPYNQKKEILSRIEIFFEDECATVA